MTTIRPSTDYPLGNTDAEHERLIRQAARVAPTTERFFREAGIGPGQRVLDIGSGVGDVAMLVARLVGPSGEVVAIERDPKSIAKARARVTEAGFHNVSFNESDVGEIPDGKPFDAAVGRFILMYLPDPVAALRQFHNWCGREECLFFRNHVGSRSLRIWRRYLFGSQRPLSLTRQCAHLPITKWERSFTTHS